MKSRETAPGQKTTEGKDPHINREKQQQKGEKTKDPKASLEGGIVETVNYLPNTHSEKKKIERRE